MTDKTRLLEFQAGELVSYLLFRVKDSVYGVHVRCVNEIVLLPELKVIAERTRHFVGVVNLRGDVVPVMDLELRLGRKRSRASIDDYLLVLEFEDRRLALIVNDVLGVERIEQENRKGDGAAELGFDATAIESIATVDDRIVMLLDINGLMTSAGPLPTEGLLVDETAESESLSFAASRGSKEAFVSKDLAVFRRRADQLRQSSMGQESEEWTSLAVAEIGGEFYGFELEFVREFFEVQQITAVPCCPPYIIGNLNLRGDVVTVIDIRSHLNLPIEGRIAKGKVIIAQTDEMTVGVMVDQLHGVFYLPVVDVSSAASGVSAAGDTPIKGTVQFNETMMSILDLSKLLSLESWVVDEVVGHS